MIFLNGIFHYAQPGDVPVFWLKKSVRRIHKYLLLRCANSHASVPTQKWKKSDTFPTSHDVDRKWRKKDKISERFRTCVLFLFLFQQPVHYSSECGVSTSAWKQGMFGYGQLPFSFRLATTVLRTFRNSELLATKYTIQNVPILKKS